MSDSDKIKMIIVVRHDLKMRMGKAIAQGGHAVLQGFWEYEMEGRKLPSIYKSWKVKWGEAKIGARVDSLEELQEIARKARDAGLEVHEVVDSGLTEFGGVPTMTCISVGPDYSSKIDPVTGHLKLL
jgi:peptidyl-tRNA hydrolase, PTH2 family